MFTCECGVVTKKLIFHCSYCLADSDLLSIFDLFRNENLCPNCNIEIFIDTFQCPNCNNPLYIPTNVVRAYLDQQQFEERFQEEIKELTTKKKRKLNNCKSIVQKNMAVSINMDPKTLVSIIEDSRYTYVNLHYINKANMIRRMNKELLGKRTGIDYLLFGVDGDKIVFGAINLGTIGLISYGPICVFLKEESIRERTSFLMQNSFDYYNTDSSGITLHITPGERVLWEKASEMVIYKHRKELLDLKTPKKESIAKLILESKGKLDDKFIEAQIMLEITVDCLQKDIY